MLGKLVPHGSVRFQAGWFDVLSVLPWVLFLLGTCFHQCKTKCANVFEVPEMPEAEVLEEEEEEEAPEEVAPIAEPGEPEAPPAEGIRWCSERVCHALGVAAVLSALCPSAFCGAG